MLSESGVDAMVVVAVVCFQKCRTMGGKVEYVCIYSVPLLAKQLTGIVGINIDRPAAHTQPPLCVGINIDGRSAHTHPPPCLATHRQLHWFRSMPRVTRSLNAASSDNMNDSLLNQALARLHWTPSQPCLFPTKANKKCQRSHCVDAQLAPIALRKVLALFEDLRHTPTDSVTSSVRLLAQSVLQLIDVARCTVHSNAVVESEHWLWHRLVSPVLVAVQHTINAALDIGVRPVGFIPGQDHKIATLDRHAMTELDGLYRVLARSTFADTWTGFVTAIMMPRTINAELQEYIPTHPKENSPTHPKERSFSDDVEDLDSLFDFEAASSRSS
ncbi:hypothetical protein AC578_4020 [Pseudocercospora eumusae]|uniref:Uncharacterized protein n=1 Tax=Pseudocercospora eumusae TaxID=321146 RepID=A0A139HDU3_9PEZI|nr:hypothetical protein AC578_4020 [Pseudocercospora eumusae]